MNIFKTINAVALLTMAFAMSGCEESEDTPGEAITERTAEPVPEQPTPATEPAPEAARSQPAEPQGATGETADMPVIDNEGNEVGSLTVEPAAQGVRLSLQVDGLTPGPHAVHFHEHGRCDPPEFESAGAHFNPTDAQHGMPDMDEDPQDKDHHVGDMLNQDVDDQGTLNTVLVNQTATLGAGENNLLDEDGSALIVHADPDDYESQPSGNAGARVACAVISSDQATGSR